MAHKTIKILLLDTGNEWGGGTNSMLELLKRIDRSRFAVQCCFYHNYRRGQDEPLEQVLNALDIPVIFIPQRRQPLWAKVAKELLRSLVFFHRDSRQKVTHFVDSLWRIKPNALKIRQLLVQHDVDLLYMNNQPGSNAEGYLATDKLPVAVVQHCRIEPVLNAGLVRMVNQRADAIIAVSSGVHKVLLEQGVAAEKCVTVFNAIDIRQTLPVRETMREQLLIVPPETFVFGSIGSLITRKSHHHTLQALEKFATAFPEADWRMVILGEGPQHNALQQQAQSSGIANRVMFTGFRSNPMDYLAAFDVFILASKSEGLPRVILEAMLLKTAVIGSRVTGTAELIAHNRTGLLYDYGDIQSLFEQMKTLWLDATMRQQLILQANSRVKECYAIEHYVSGVETILQNATNGKPSHV
ncbi:glycosyltransferase [Erwinia psidii]|uniref:Glycosyltransferase n=1 Tax=Erwinia psidii TaxID=69224 RepID=A0A3N6SBF7_9GAMM|nr:glycosyltransferase [Erwinia psidii]MCX8959159.1 glycosyltransferase [Erwinia psidii]MCX8962223.1 glycosyltransferase [Erwinia psidii]MCX8966861.1 glycosyltransferase [Erwinia psidii]RQM37283.1 glycosyltransferase [Erwinia psidii]